MSLGVSTATIAVVHVSISVVAIGSGMIVLVGMLCARRLEAWTALFLATTILTIFTGFLFHAEAFGPAHAIGVASLVALMAAAFARYLRRLTGLCRWIYVAGSGLALYLNIFAGLVAAFQFVPALKPMAPTLSHPPLTFTQLTVAFSGASFLVTQLFVATTLAILVALAGSRFHPKE